MGLLCATIAAAPGLAHAQAADLFYERTVMTAADARCGLFAPEVSAALAAGAAQARGAALRAGTPQDTLKALERGARAQASRVDCRSRDMAIAAQRVRDAFAGFAKVTRLSYPGDMAGWQADRNEGAKVRWRLVQHARTGPDPVSFGLAGAEGAGALLAVVRFGDGATPYSARLILRDSDRTMGPYLSRRGSEALRAIPLERRLPQGSGLKSYVAEARSPAGADLLPRGAESGWAFRFPSEAARELAGLDPREAVAVEFYFADTRRPVRRAFIEVGDFAAGRAFLTVAAR
jgi:hypothetical protein